jgi:hypothetical protein
VDFSVLLLNLLAKTNNLVSLSQEFGTKDFDFHHNLSIVSELQGLGSEKVCTSPFTATLLVTEVVRYRQSGYEHPNEAGNECHPTECSNEIIH